jgi:hypothetical protein
MTEVSHSKKNSIPAMIGAGVVGIFAWAVGNYTGFFLLLPVGLAAVAGFLLSVLAPKNNKPIVPASAIQVGQALWILMGLLATRSVNSLLIRVFVNFDLRLIEPIVFLVFALVLAFEPSIWIVASLAVYQLPSLVINAIAFVDATPNTNEHKALLVHIVFRAAAVGMMIFGLFKLHKDSTAEVSAAIGEIERVRTD